MLKKTPLIILKIFWVIIMLFIPTILFICSIVIPSVIHAVLHIGVSKAVFLFLLYFAPVIFIALVICVSLFIWKKSYSLFALFLGFLIMPQLASIISPFFGMTFRDGMFVSTIVILEVLHAWPFAIVTFMIAIIITVLNITVLKKRGKPLEIDEPLPPSKDEDN